MAFTVVKKLDLSYLGEGWSGGTYLKFSGLTFAETRDFAQLSVEEGSADTQKSLDMVLGIVKQHFLEGMGFDGEKITQIEADDLESLPVDVITKSIELLAGTSDPKSSAA